MFEEKLAAGGGFGFGVSGFYLGYKKLAARLGLGVWVGACSSFGAASPVCACMCLLNRRRISEGINRLALNWPKFGDIFSYSGVKMPILWGFALLPMQEGGFDGSSGDVRGSSVQTQADTPTPPRAPRGYYVVPPRPHTNFHPKPKLIATLNAFLKSAPRKFLDFFHIANLDRTLKAFR